MRNADKQSKSTGDGKWSKHYRPLFDNHKPDAPLQLICEIIKADNPRDLRNYKLAYDIVHDQIEKEFSGKFKRK